MSSFSEDSIPSQWADALQEAQLVLPAPAYPVRTPAIWRQHRFRTQATAAAGRRAQRERYEDALRLMGYDTIPETWRYFDPPHLEEVERNVTLDIISVRLRELDDWAMGFSARVGSWITRVEGLLRHVPERPMAELAWMAILEARRADWVEVVEEEEERDVYDGGPPFQALEARSDGGDDDPDWIYTEPELDPFDPFGFNDLEQWAADGPANDGEQTPNPVYWAVGDINLSGAQSEVTDEDDVVFEDVPLRLADIPRIFGARGRLMLAAFVCYEVCRNGLVKQWLDEYGDWMLELRSFGSDAELAQSQELLWQVRGMCQMARAIDRQIATAVRGWGGFFDTIGQDAEWQRLQGVVWMVDGFESSSDEDNESVEMDLSD